MIIYHHKSIVNGVEVFRVWKDGNLVGEFKTEHFKQAILESYTQGRISMLKQNGLLAEEFWNKTYE